MRVCAVGVVVGVAEAGFQVFRMFDAAPWMQAAHASHAACYALVAAYLAAVFFGRRWMADREPYNLRLPLVVWNTALSVFSAAGFGFTVRELACSLASHGWDAVVCGVHGAPGGEHIRFGYAGIWVALFAASKVPELADTAFIVLRKRPLLLLHWYHHATVLAYCWLAYGWRSNAGFLFAVMNYGVHAVMYAYYALAAAGCKPPHGWIVTRLQIAQMAAGCLLCVYVWARRALGEACDDLRATALATLLYASYLALFVDFSATRWRGGAKDAHQKQ